MRDDEDKWDKEQQHLDDHHHDLWLEDALAKCDHEDFVFMGVDDCEYESITFEVKCEFCGVIGELLLLVKDFDCEIRKASAYSTSWPENGE